MGAGKHELRRASQSKPSPEEWGNITWLAGRAVGIAEGLTVGRVVIEVGKQNPRHYHTTCEEVITLLAGRIEHSAGNERMVMEAGDTLVVPPGMPHNAVNIDTVPADMIVAYSSADRDFHLE